MISTERLAQISALMSANLPLATHGSNAFDAATKITVADVYGLIDAAQVGLVQPVAPAAPTPVTQTVDTVVQTLTTFSPPDRQSVYLELQGMEKLAAEQDSTHTPPATSVGAGTEALGSVPAAAEGTPAAPAA